MKRFTLVRWSKRETPALGRLKTSAIFNGLAWALGVTVFSWILMCAWVALSRGPVYNLSVFITAGSIAGAFAGGVAGGKSSYTHGSMHGLIVGLLYGVILAALFVAGSAWSFVIAGMLTRVVLLGAIGAAGGLFGVNMRGWRRDSSKRKIFLPRDF